MILPVSVLFISDLHLDESRPAISRAFYSFLNEKAASAQALYILGDFFDAWIGDDDDAPLPQEVAQALRALSDKGVAIYLMHGNRDFLLGDAYARACGASMLAEDTVIDLYGTPTLLTHGDNLCTDDAAYQQFRAQVRSPAWQQQVLAQPLEVRRAMAAGMRSQSESMNSLKAEDIMDVSETSVLQAMARAGVQRLIHGHTHRPARHSMVLNGKPVERIVLGDWHNEGWCLVANSQEIRLEKWSLE